MASNEIPKDSPWAWLNNGPWNHFPDFITEPTPAELACTALLLLALTMFVTFYTQKWRWDRDQSSDSTND